MTNYESGAGPGPGERYGPGAPTSVDPTAPLPPTPVPPVPPEPLPPVSPVGSTEEPDDGSDGGTRQKAREVGGQAAQAGGEVAATAKEKARDVAGEAGQQAREVASEAGQRARDLVEQARGQVRSQANSQRDRVASSLRSLGDELEAMATKGDQAGPATELAREASDRTRALASYLEQREPGDLINEVRDFARRRPGVFLLGAVAAGVVAGRLTRGIAAASGGSSDRSTGDLYRQRGGERTFVEPDVSYGQGAAIAAEPLTGSPTTTGQPADEGAWPTPAPQSDPPRPGSTQSW
jgi:vacuolar-type H+-ATPase subunit H